MMKLFYRALLATCFIAIFVAEICFGQAQIIDTYTLAQDGTAAPMTRRWPWLRCKESSIASRPNFTCSRATNTRPQFWLDLLAKDGRWLQGRKRKPLAGS